MQVEADVTFGVLGPVTAWDPAGAPLPLRGPRHRALLARLLAARGRVVPVTLLVDDLWGEDPPRDAVGTVRTFVAALRRALEPRRPPRSPARLLVTEGPGYALRVARELVDADRFEQALQAARALPPGPALTTLREALGWWRGPAYADVGGQPWARREASRLLELHHSALELEAGARLGTGDAAGAVAGLRAHVDEHPRREEGWRLLATALLSSDRRADALDVLRRARATLAGDLGLDTGRALADLEREVLGPPSAPADPWTATADAQVRAGTPRSRVRSAAGLLRTLAVTGGPGLEAARERRLATIRAAEELGDPDLTARVVGGHDVPALWTRSDDPRQAAAVAAAARRALAGLAADALEVLRARLLATIAVETRGSTGPGPGAAREAAAIARRLGDPALLVHALNAVFLHAFDRPGRARERAAIGAELVEVSARHGFATHEVLGHLVGLQSCAALGDLAGADAHAAAADRIAAQQEAPLAGVFTTGYRGLRAALRGEAFASVAAAHARTAAALEGAGMPGVRAGLLPLSLLAARVQHGLPPTGPDGSTGSAGPWGPLEPWARPLLLAQGGDRGAAVVALRGVPDPPPGHLLEALWCLVALAALDLGEVAVARRAHAALLPAAGEHAGAGSGLFTLGPVSGFLDALGRLGQ